MRLLARASAGLLFWAFGFSLLYGLQGLGCARGWAAVDLAGGSLFRWAMVGTWLLLAAGSLGFVAWAWRAPAGLQRRICLAAALSGSAATFVTGLPAAIASACL
jgi:hypothetical protein